MLILLGTEGCHLCEQAEEILTAVLAERNEAVAVELVDIAEQPQWQESYAERIPVIYHAQTGTELSWPFDKKNLHDFIDMLHEKNQSATI